MKTADEILYELGYKKEKDTQWETVYRDIKGIYEIIVDKNRKIITCNMHSKQCAISFEETLALAKLVKEIEGIF